LTWVQNKKQEVNFSKARGKVPGVPARATVMDEASEERSRNVTDAPRLVYVIIFMPTCRQKDILALKFHRYHVSEHVQTEFDIQRTVHRDIFL